MHQMKESFRIGPADNLQVLDGEIYNLLCEVYVEGGYTASEVAPNLFDPQAVRLRGQLFAARTSTSELAGIVLAVYPPSSARRLTQGDTECEMHLLGVRPAYRGSGLGLALAERVLSDARDRGMRGISLFTQPSMVAAHRLYERLGFARAPRDFERNGKTYWVYSRPLV